ncbi:hypothetical protein IAU59_005887 [Kwoniella sp. CBS 9459]
MDSSAALGFASSAPIVTQPPGHSADHTASTSAGLPRRRPSLTLSPHQIPSVSSDPQNIPVPRRHGSISSKSPRSVGLSESSLSTSPSLRRQSRGSFGSLSGSVLLPPPLYVSTSGGNLFSRPGQLDETAESRLNLDDGEWLARTVKTVIEGENDAEPSAIDGDERVEQGVKALLAGQRAYIVVHCRHAETRYAFFDYADLNTFLLLVLEATSGSGGDQQRIEEGGVELARRRAGVLRRLRNGDHVNVESACNISGKNPFHSVPHNTALRSALRLFAKGVHRIAVTDHTVTEQLGVLSHTTLLRYLLSLPGNCVPAAFQGKLESRELGLSLHPLISLEATATVLDAMQTMSIHGLRALGVMDCQIGYRRDSTPGSDSSSSYSASPRLMASDDESDGNLVSIVRDQDCALLVVPSVGKEALAMSLADMTRMVEQTEEAGNQRGEERVPVHTLSPSSTLLYACHVILATSSSRVFIRNSSAISPVLSANSAAAVAAPARGLDGLPQPPMTQLSPHSVLSIADVFKTLERLYLSK